MLDPTGALKMKSKESSLEADTSSDLLLRQAFTRRSLGFDQANLVDFERHEEWAEKLFTARFREPPQGYCKGSHQQMLNADAQLFVRLAELTRSEFKRLPLDGRSMPFGPKPCKQIEMKGVEVTNQRRDQEEVSDTSEAFPPGGGQPTADTLHQIQDCRGRLQAQKHFQQQAFCLASGGEVTTGRTCAMTIVSLREKAVRLTSRLMPTWCPRMMQSGTGTESMWNGLCKTMNTRQTAWEKSSASQNWAGTSLVDMETCGLSRAGSHTGRFCVLLRNSDVGAHTRTGSSRSKTRMCC